VAQDVIISEYDCGTVKYIEASPLIEAVTSSSRSATGCWGACRRRRSGSYTGEIIVQANSEINEELAQKIEDSGLERVRIRSALTCESKRGICVMCYGRNLGTGNLAELGEAVGIIAAQSIGEPGTQLTMRTFHIGGTASKVVATFPARRQEPGSADVPQHPLGRESRREIVALNRNGEIVLHDDAVARRSATRSCREPRSSSGTGRGCRRAAPPSWSGTRSRPDPDRGDRHHRLPDVMDEVTIREEIDEVTGLAQRVIIEDPEGKLQPRVSVKAPSGSAKRPAR